MENEIYIQIMRYVDDEMDATERIIFEDSLKDEEIAAEVESYRQMKAIGREVFSEIGSPVPLVTEETKEQYADVWNLIQKVRKKWESRDLKWVDDLIENALQSAAVPDNPPDSLRMAFLNYRKKNFKMAIEDFDSVQMGGTRGDDDETLTTFYRFYYKGLSHMAEDDFEKAISVLEEAVTSCPDEPSRSKAQWYLALACLKTGNTEKTEALLRQVAENEKAEEFKQKAIDLLKELKNK